MMWADCSVVCGSTCSDLVCQTSGSNEPFEPGPNAFGFVNLEQKVVTADNCTIQFGRNNSDAADFCINFCNKQVALTCNLLVLRLDERAFHFITKNNSLPMELDPCTLV